MAKNKNDNKEGKTLPIKLITTLIIILFLILVIGFMILPAYFDKTPFGRLFHNEPAPWALSEEDQKKFKLSDSELKGRHHFIEYCASCHGPDGLGNGPSSITLRKRMPNFKNPSEKYINGLNRLEILKTIEEGIPNSEMPSYHYLPKETKDQITDFLLYIQK